MTWEWGRQLYIMIWVVWFHWYCWWKKSCTSWYGKYPMICRVSCILGGAGFLPSTVSIVHLNSMTPWIHLVVLENGWNLSPGQSVKISSLILASFQQPANLPDIWWRFFRSKTGHDTHFYNWHSHWKSMKMKMKRPFRIADFQGAMLVLRGLII